MTMLNGFCIVGSDQAVEDERHKKKKKKKKKTQKPKKTKRIDKPHKEFLHIPFRHQRSVAPFCRG